MNEALNPTDAALWDIERNPALRTTIVVVLRLDRGIDRDRLLNDLDAATRTMPRLRQRVVEPVAGIGIPHWELIEDFDIGDYVHFPAARTLTEESLKAVCADLASAPFDRTDALWSGTYLGTKRGPAALVMKVHHSLTDGIGGIELLDAVLETSADAPPRDLGRIAEPEPGQRPPLLTVAGTQLKQAVDLQAEMLSAVASATKHPMRTAAGAVAGLQSTLRLLSPVASSLSRLMTERSPDRSVTMSAVDLDRMRAAARRHECTINHLAFAAVVQAVADYHELHDSPLQHLRMLMPVSFRNDADPAGGNQWGPVRFVAPTTIDDPLDRLQVMRTIATRSQREPALQFSHKLAGIVQILPPVLSSGIIAGMMQGVDVVVTNIPGLSETRYLCGARVAEMHAFAPTGGAALNVAVLSHLDQAHIGILSDSAAVEDPERLMEFVDHRLNEIIDAAEVAEPMASPSDALQRTGSRSETDRPRRLSGFDTSFLRLESAQAPMSIGGVLVAEGGSLRDDEGRLKIDAARRHIEARLDRVPHFRRKLSEVPLGLGRPLWIDDPDFDISRHVRLAALPHPGTRQDLLDLAATLHETMLDRKHPLWKLWIVDGLADGNVGIIEKAHHALVDGVGGVELTAALLDFEPQAKPDLPIRVPPHRPPGPGQRLFGAAVDQVLDPFRLARTAARTMRTAPGTVVEQTKGLGLAALEFVKPGGVAPAASFNQAIERGRAIRSLHFDFGILDAIREPHDATINDVVLAVVTGGFGRWLTTRGEPLVDMHAAVPVAIHGQAIGHGGGNHLGALPVRLPVLEPDASRRIVLIREQMRRLKSAHEADGVALALDAMDYLPAASLYAAKLLIAQRLANVVVTNVPGPREPLYFLDAEVTTMTPIVPLGPNLGLAVAALSYRNELTLTLVVDPHLCPDIDLLTASFEAEVAELLVASTE